MSVRACVHACVCDGVSGHMHVYMCVIVCVYLKQSRRDIVHYRQKCTLKKGGVKLVNSGDCDFPFCFLPDLFCKYGAGFGNMCSMK